MECRNIVDKITARIKTWSTRALIHSVLMGIFTFWARIIIIPQGVIKQITALCRNFLWGAVQGEGGVQMGEL